jgi:hypothetical protein
LAVIRYPLKKKTFCIGFLGLMRVLHTL